MSVVTMECIKAPTEYNLINIRLGYCIIIYAMCTFTPYNGRYDVTVRFIHLKNHTIDQQNEIPSKPQYLIIPQNSRSISQEKG